MMDNQVGMATNQQNGNNGNQAGGDNLMDVGGLTKVILKLYLSIEMFSKLQNFSVSEKKCFKLCIIVLDFVNFH